MCRLFNLKSGALGLIAGLLLLVSASASATSASISHSFQSSSGVISGGSLVSLDPKHTGYVELSNSSNAQSLVGLAVGNNGSLLAVNSGNTTTQVATSGITTALVSDVNGPIAVGDQVSVSPFDGIGMKSGPGTRFIGLARTAFNSKSPGVTSQSIADKSGHKTKVNLGYVNVSINIGTVPVNSTGNNLNALQSLAKSLTGHVVSTVRILLSMLVVLVTVMALIPLIYGAIYSGIVSIGRNPLAKHDILLSLASVLLVALLLSVVAAVTVFFLLH
jgi:hypothetical protein